MIIIRDRTVLALHDSTDPEPALHWLAGLRLSKNPLNAGPLDSVVCCDPEAAGQIGGLGFFPLPGC